MNIHIDPEFKALIPPMDPSERAQLERNLIASGGARDPLVVWNDTLIDGHNRYDICSTNGLRFTTCEPKEKIVTREDAKIWIIRNQLGRRNLPNMARGELALAMEELIAARAKENQGQRNDIPQNSAKCFSPVDTRAEIAKAAGVSHDTIAKIKTIRDEAPAPIREAARAQRLSVDAAYKAHKQLAAAPAPVRERAIAKLGDKVDAKAAIKEALKEIHAEEQAAVPSDLPKLSERYVLHHCSLSTIPIADESVDVIITDPPYPREFLDTFGELSEMAARVLRPGGSCVVMSGQSYLPDVIERLCRHLKYQWTIAYLTPGGQATQLWERNVNTFWKPLIWMVKGSYSGSWVGDVIKSDVNDNDKRFHHWGQSESGMARIVEAFSKPGHTIMDPFLGGGTTGVVALGMNRKFVGCDVDEKAITTSSERLLKATS